MRSPITPHVSPIRRIACVHWSELPIAAHRLRLVHSNSQSTTEPVLSEPRWSVGTPGDSRADSPARASADASSPRGTRRGQRHAASVPLQQLSLALGPHEVASHPETSEAQEHGRRARQPAAHAHALVRGEGGGARIVALDGQAHREGVREGMTVAQARARVPGLALASFEPARLVAVEAQIVEAISRLSPRQGRAEALRPACASSLPTAGDFLLELVLPRDLGAGAEAHAIAELVKLVRGLELGPFSIGVADGAFAAICAAHVEIARPKTRGRVPVRVVPHAIAGESAAASESSGALTTDAAFLAPLSSALLPASPLVAQALQALGLTKMAEVAALPLEGAQARFGEEGRTLVMLARGQAPPALATFVPSADPSVEVDLEALDPAGEGATTLDELVFALRTACLRLCPPLLARGLGVGELEVLLESRGQSTRLVVRPARPELDPQALFELSRATLEGARLARVEQESDVPVARLRLTVTSLVPATATSESLPFARRDASLLPLDVALARLRGRFGAGRVVTPVRHEDPRPEQRGRFVRAEVGAVAERAITPPPAPTLKERLRAPPPAVGVVVLSRMPAVGDPWPLRGEAPPSVGFGGRSGGRRATRTVEISPPERIVGGWWSEPFELVYHWLTADDGTRALFARTPVGRSAREGAPDEGLRLVAIAD